MTAAHWLSLFLLQAAAPDAPPAAASAEAVRLREAGQAAMRQWIVCVVDAAKARSGSGAAAETAVADAGRGCAGERAATGAAIAAAERGAGNPVTDAEVAALIGQLEATVLAGATVIVRGDDGKDAGAKRRR